MVPDFPVSTRDTDLLIVGGYGVVGRRIGARLAAQFPGRVIVAGRNHDKARAACDDIGQGARPRRIDLDDRGSVESALRGVGTVVACAAQKSDLHLLRAAIERGLAYTDLAPEPTFWRDALARAADAQRTGARVVLGAGLVPGLSNILARWLETKLGGVRSLETAVFLSLGDEYGPSSLDYVLQSATDAFEILKRGRVREVPAFSERRRIDFPPPVGPQVAITSR